ncbi:nitrite reductase large subunit NirB [Mycobacterium kiyosense]|uniref:assimilatory sulfite reductase (ferredoxin) n=1 Tax=Mycobacterium kiyosense TaxID=2871094 RepID=A0A9P3UWF7_9MYCO|nr:nitrite reductase large subunit NirB [Mycobacterium kiyosense]GLB84946.1 nitrite reductase large subunit [Mycobacterium kiyosense]GLB98156.1 nitrite reductase large subunit [Mycobacterium kiyosense]GLD32955.1 nitrite reductase large subunit [Mycobacterium kiyosense]GLD38322.1 nitrite reductase large subunit [Mycobacterium kiyosense]
MPSTARHAIVVGHGMVGHRFVEALRARDSAGSWRITVLAEESDAAYDRVGLTSYTESWDRSLLALPGNDYAGDQLVQLQLNTKVAEINCAAKTVVTAKGDRYGYDALVLATGSYAFVPPVKGHDLPCCHVYRTLDDLDAIRAAASRAADSGRAGLVIGGGLLGLEAANALRQFGLPTHVVEMMPRLMAQQIDEAGGALLARMIGELGIEIHVGIGTESIEPVDDSFAQVRLSDGQVVDAGVVIFAAGIRPRDELARAAGLVMGERGGVLTDSACRTSDPAVYAIGEVAAIEGRCYGLVGPGYTSAEVVADRLLDGAAEFPAADLSTKLKLLGVDVASFGDAMGVTPNCLEVVINDAVNRTYAKLVLSDDARTLLGGVLVGDASNYGVLRPMVGSELPGDPLALIAPAAEGGAALGIGALPDSAQICSCNNVTKGDLKCAIADGCADVPALKTCTAAGTSCGSCVPLLKQLLEAEGVEQSKALCEHFSQSRAELFQIISATEIRTFSGLVQRFGYGKGCDICKPVVASILASTGSEHILAGEQASLQDSNDHFLANIQKNGSYSVVPRVPGGDIKPEHLILIGQIAQDFGLYTKITGGQRIDMFGARVDQLPAIWKRLVDAGMESGHAYGKALRTVKSCVGSDWCRYGQQDSVQLAIDLELRYRGLRAPHKIKLGVSGCARECAEARSKDVGVIATEKGWNLYVGGNGGMTPKHAQLMASDLDTETLVRYVDRFLMYYIRTADRLQRTAPWLESLGLEHVREVVCDDSLGLAEEFEAAVRRHVADYRCEWKGVLEDPDKLSRFVSFVNAPDAVDDTVQFTERAGRKVPVPLGLPRIR